MTYKITFSAITIAEVEQAHQVFEKEPGTLESWRARHMTSADSGLTPRMANYWVKAGLLPDIHTDDEQRWNKFSLMDIVFIAVATRLREFGMSMKQLHQTSKTLSRKFFIPSAPKGSREYKQEMPTLLSMLETAFVRTIALNNDGDTYLLVASDGTAIMMTDRDLLLNRQHDTLPPAYIYLNMNEIMADTFVNRQVKKWATTSKWLSHGENAVIDTIRESTQRRDIKVRLAPDGNVDLIETEEIVSRAPDGDLHSIIGHISHGSISLNVQDGSVTSVKKTIKKKVKK